MLCQRAPVGHEQRRHHGHTGSVGIRQSGLDHIRHGVPLDLQPTHGRECVPHTAEKQTHVVVNLG